MNNYINQLLEDLENAERKFISLDNLIDNSEESFEKHIEAVERFISGEGHIVLLDLIGLYAEQFPPVHLLSKKQQQKVISAFTKCVLSWNIVLDWPDNIPTALRYELLFTTFDSQVTVENHGFIHLEFCFTM